MLMSVSCALPPCLPILLMSCLSAKHCLLMSCLLMSCLLMSCLSCLLMSCLPILLMLGMSVMSCLPVLMMLYSCLLLMSCFVGSCLSRTMSVGFVGDPLPLEGPSATLNSVVTHLTHR